MFEMEKWAQTRLFSSCKFRTPFYGRSIAGLALLKDVCGPDNRDMLILTYGGELASHPSGISSALDHIEKSGAAGIVLARDSMDKAAVDVLARECERRGLILAEMTDSISFVDFIREFYNFMPCAATGELCSYGEIFQRFQSAFFTHGLDRLLKELESRGLPAFIVNDDGYYKVRVGAFLNMDNAANMERILRNMGYPTLMVREQAVY